MFDWFVLLSFEPLLILNFFCICQLYTNDDDESDRCSQASSSGCTSKGSGTSQCISSDCVSRLEKVVAPPESYSTGSVQGLQSTKSLTHGTSSHKATEISVMESPTSSPYSQNDTLQSPFPQFDTQSMVPSQRDTIKTAPIRFSKTLNSASTLPITTTIRVSSSGLNGSLNLKKTMERERGATSGYDVSIVFMWTIIISHVPVLQTMIAVEWNHE